jgi:hypothetical protein
MEMEGNLGPDYLHADIKAGPNGTLLITGELGDMPFEQTIQKL